MESPPNSPDDPIAAAFAEAEVRCRRGDLAGAAALCAQVLRTAPRHGGALWLQGWLCGARGDHAGEARALATAREVDPANPEVAYRLALARFELQQYPEAADTFEAALRLAPDRAEAHHALGRTRWRLCEYAAARAAFEAAHRLEPDNPVHVHNLLFCACYDPSLTPDALRDLHVEWAGRAVRPPSDASAPHANPADPDRPLKVGYLSPDFQRHPVAYFLGPLMGGHDPRAVVAYGYASVARPDALTQVFQRVCPNWRDVSRMDDAAVAQQIREDGIDILVDLAGHTGDTRLAVLAHRPAPVQVSYLGYPATTGLDGVGWRLTDAVANPPGTEAFYTERLARMEGGFCCYMPPMDAPDPGPPPALRNGRPSFGSLVHTNKVNPATVALWARVLDAVPEARMVLFRHHTLAAPSMRERYLGLFQAHGVGPERIAFGWNLPPAEQGGSLAVYRDVDVVLDTLPFNGHTSTCEALWMGVPVVTLTGPEFAGRLSAAVLAMAGLGGLVAGNPGDFVARAAATARDGEGLARFRQGARAHLKGTRLLDAPACTRALEAAYRDMWRDWCAGRGAG